MVKKLCPFSAQKILVLTYNEHIKKLVSSCTVKLCQINRVKDSFDKETLKLVISSLVISKLFYCSSTWSNTSSTNISKLQSVQNFAIIKVLVDFHHVLVDFRQLTPLVVLCHNFFLPCGYGWQCNSSKMI